MPRSVFYVSDSTAMTAKGLGKSLLSQFENVLFSEHLRPYIDSRSKVMELIAELKDNRAREQNAPIIFASMMDESLMELLSSQVDGVIDIFQPFLATLERLMAEKSSKAVGRAHHGGDDAAYKHRIRAIDFTLATDDGLRLNDYDEADVILLGVSRSGKTPTALYLALNFGLKVANYPFTAEDLPRFLLNPAQTRNRHKLMGLLISLERLTAIRKERRPNGIYADPAHVRMELDALKELFEREKIPCVDTTTRSVEEIAASILGMLASRIH